MSDLTHDELCDALTAAYRTSMDPDPFWTELERRAVPVGTTVDAYGGTYRVDAIKWRQYRLVEVSTGERAALNLTARLVAA